MKIEKGKYKIYSVRRSGRTALHIATVFLALLVCLAVFLIALFSCERKPDKVVVSSSFKAETSSIVSSIPKEESSAIAKPETSSETSSVVSKTSSLAPVSSKSSTSSKSQSATVNTTNPANNNNLIYNINSYAKEWTYTIDKSKPVPLQPKVDNSYFSNAMFVGDSITTGIDLYGIIKGVPVVAYTGINTNTVLTSKVFRTNSGKITFLQKMKQYKPKYIYIMLGTNGIHFQSKTSFITGYSKFVDAVKKQHPNAIIYLQSILPVSAKKSSDKRFANSKINEYNALVQKLAKDKGVYYLNVAEAFKDGKGNMPSAATSDGIHFGPAYYKRWIEYLKTHTVYTGKIPTTSNTSSNGSSSTIPVTRPTNSSSSNTSKPTSSSLLSEDKIINT